MALRRAVLALCLALAGAPAFAATTPNSVVTPQWPNRGVVMFSPATSTSSTMAAGSSTSVTASISYNVMTVTAVGSGTIVNGAYLTATTTVLPTNEQVVQQLSGTTGGAGTYQISIGIQAGVASETVTVTYGVLTVGGTVAGTFQVGGLLSGTSVPAACYITQLGSGTGGTGTYDTNCSPTISSGEAIDTDQIGGWKILFAPGWGAPQGVNGSKCYGAIGTNTDTTTHAISLGLANSGILFSLSTPMPLATVTSTANAGNANADAPNNLLAQPNSGATTIPWSNGGLPLDSEGNPYLLLQNGDFLEVTYATAITSGKYLYFYSPCVDF